MLQSRLQTTAVLPQPNEPIAGFDLPDGSRVHDWERRVSSLKRETLVDELTLVLAEIQLPVLEPDDARHDHLRIYHHLSQLQELIRTVIKDAIAVGYPHALNVIADKAEIEPQLSHIAKLLFQLNQQTDVIQRQTAKKLTDDIAISIGPVSATLTALKESVELARKKIVTATSRINVSALADDLSAVGRASTHIVDQMRELGRDIPQWLRAALKGVVQIGTEVAERGLQLLHRVYRSEIRQAPEFGSVSVEQIESERDLTEREAREVGSALRSARMQLQASVNDVCHVLRIRKEFVEAIEDGNFGLLPGRPYATGWVRGYACYVGLDPEKLVQSVRKAVPGGFYYRDRT
jgi:hypothetical protein